MTNLHNQQYIDLHSEQQTELSYSGLTSSVSIPVASLIGVQNTTQWGVAGSQIIL